MLLYHGTSLARWLSATRDNALVIAASGVPKISFTTDMAVAIYWANLSSEVDLDEKRGDGHGVILTIDSNELLRCGYVLTPFDDDVWGEGNCTHEKEIACWSSINLTDVAFETFLYFATPVGIPIYGRQHT